MVVADLTKALLPFLAFLLVVPLNGEAQAPSPAVDLLTVDPADDVMMRAGPGPPQSATSTGQADPLDILRVTVGRETEKDFVVTLQTKALPSTQGSNPTRVVSFDFGGVHYRVGLGITRMGGGGPGQGGNGNPQGALQSFDTGGNRYRTVATVATQVDPGTHTITFTVPRASVVSKDHVAIRFADSLTNVVATTAQTFANPAFLPGGNDPASGGVVMNDRAPDSGAGGSFLFQKGRVGEGSVELNALEPIRVSNGEATTVVYRVDARNLGTEDRTFQLEAREVPGDWSVRIPEYMAVGAGKTVTFPVILGLPFTHKHGETATFELHAQAVEDPASWSSVRLGVFWTETPQPAGHHPQLWLHSAPADGSMDPSGAFSTAYSFRQAWINALEEETEEGTDEGNVPAFFNEELTNTVFAREPPSGQEWTAEWFFPMSPGLLIGVDMDPAGVGQLNVKVYHDTPAQQTKLIARFLYCDPERTAQGSGPGGGGGNCSSAQVSNRWSPIAQGESATTSAGAQETVAFDVPLAVLPEGDLQPYKHGANIGLELKLVTNVPENAMAPRPHPEVVVKGSTGRSVLTLPLIEYHDPIDQAFDALGKLQLKTDAAEKKVNPGRTTVFRLHVTNTAAEADEVGLEAHGPNTAWVQIFGDQRFALKGHETRDVAVAVQVPQGEHAGNYVDLVIVAQSEKDVATVSATRLRATIVEGEDIPDEAAQLVTGDRKSTPGLEGLMALAVVAVLTAFARRRF